MYDQLLYSHYQTTFLCEMELKGSSVLHGTSVYVKKALLSFIIIAMSILKMFGFTVYLTISHRRRREYRRIVTETKSR